MAQTPGLLCPHLLQGQADVRRLGRRAERPISAPRAADPVAELGGVPDGNRAGMDSPQIRTDTREQRRSPREDSGVHDEGHRLGGPWLDGGQAEGRGLASSELADRVSP
jgi:hypothetical protein